jgi:hypothetical protein
MIPELKETKYPGYYISKNGEVYRKSLPRDKKNNINEYDLVEIKPSLRGSKRDLKYQYPCINISIKDENGKFIKQIRKSIHQLVAETFIPNPNNYSEIDHIDRDKHNNHVSNLQWCDRRHNMRWNVGKSYELYDIINDKTHKGINLQKFIIENWDWISKRTKISTPKKFLQQLFGKCKYQSHVNGFILKR